MTATEDESGDRLGFQKSELMGGPSLCWHPQPSLTVLIAPLFGVELARPKEGEDENEGLTLIMTVIGWEF
jgi:hypothetical protein